MRIVGTAAWMQAASVMALWTAWMHPTKRTVGLQVGQIPVSSVAQACSREVKHLATTKAKVILATSCRLPLWSRQGQLVR